MRMDSTPQDMQGIAAQARAWLGSLRGILADAGAPGVKIHEAITALASSVEQLEAAKGKAAIIVTDPRYQAQHKLDQAKALVGDGYGAATRAALDLGAAIDQARGALARAVMPGKPAADPMAAFTAGEVAKALESAGSSSGVINTATKMLADALASGDATLAWIITGGPMQLTYKRLGVNEPMLMARFADTLASSDAKPANVAGASLLPILNLGGSGSLRGLVDAARVTVTREQMAYNSWLQASMRAGAMQGIWGEHASAPR